ncbi:carbohydrate binding family 9 domain-containing protein [Larkinella punicea]|uniref:DUF5916 domain-containing protein n=1 Tax=Larkinella punicea TaxID=2315727 RepID=A0A368JD15_9BACT|nr:DUF5916 domain-containing protein [Larkinella punicea]RCR65558.1 hypothetical protein DUE52_31325 [Larkinella punicea]
MTKQKLGRFCNWVTRIVNALIVTALLWGVACAQDGTVFQPENPPKEITGLKIAENLLINGRLDEPAWQIAKLASGFFRQFPDQGGRVAFDTEVYVLYNSRNLYLGFFCPDSLGKKAVRVPDLIRDFDFFNYDLVGVSIDPFLDKRNAIAFQTNPYGAQRDLLCFDDTFFDREWDGFWKVRTTRTDSGWVAEMQIPWATLRYPNAKQQDWGIQFVRRTRRLGEQSSWSPFPRAFTAYRMTYAGLLKGIEPPAPSVNVRMQPYLLTDYKRNFVNGRQTAEVFAPKLGGEIKWAITPHTVLDLTINTDFAQADVDRQVQNLTRFSVLFPERRQFFLENATLFNLGDDFNQPFFSRKIGLSDAGTPIPLDAGLRLVSRNLKQNFAGLFVRQRKSDETQTATTHFGVLRYSRNVGKQNRFGGMVTVNSSEAAFGKPAVTNATFSVDGFVRIKDPFSWNFMVTKSQTSTAGGDGFTALSKFIFSNNNWYAFLIQSIITKDYNPRMGFVYGSNLINNNTGVYRITRPRWKPKFMRQMDPGFYFDAYHRASDGKFQQAELTLFPIWIIANRGNRFTGNVIPTWQVVDQAFPIVGINIPTGKYYYTRYRFSYDSDLSRAFSVKTQTEFGSFYDGRLATLQGEVRFSPLPNVSAKVSYQRNRFRDVGENEESMVTHLITPEIRLSLNPRVQLTSFFQHNSVATRDIWNIRFAWEFQPLSFLYLVYNSNSSQQYTTSLQRFDTVRNEQSIAKITYLKQF